MKDGIRADIWFIKVTAIILTVKIQIIYTSAVASPYYTIQGCDDPRETLFKGVINNTHSQSLLKDEPEEGTNDTEEEDIPFNSNQKKTWIQRRTWILPKSLKATLISANLRMMTSARTAERSKKIFFCTS